MVARQSSPPRQTAEVHDLRTSFKTEGSAFTNAPFGELSIAVISEEGRAWIDIRYGTYEPDKPKNQQHLGLDMDPADVETFLMLFTTVVRRAQLDNVLPRQH